MSKKAIDYLDEVASEQPTPAGGSASAMSGSLACALMLKAVKILLRKKTSVQDIKQLSTMLSQLNVAKDSFISFATLDSEALHEMIKATNLPDDDVNKEEVIQNTLIKATMMPLRVMEYVCDVAPIQDKLLLYAPYSFISDVQTASLLLNVAFEGSKKNVLYNIKSITRKQEVDRILIQTEELTRQWSYFLRVFEQYEHKIS